MAGVASRKSRGLASTTKSYAKSAGYATPANLRCIMRANMAKRSASEGLKKRPSHRIGCRLLSTPRTH